MAVIEKFLGKTVTIPEDRLYALQTGIWAKAASQEIFFGLTEPALVLTGGANSLDWLVENGQIVNSAQSVICMITGKILFIETPVGGSIAFNEAVKKAPFRISEDPYGKGWLFTITPEGNPQAAMAHLADWSGYLSSLKNTDGFKNPEGVSGGVSGICKAVYSGIRDQKF
jgi:glycine cleavage system H lipoate-binding protein